VQTARHAFAVGQVQLDEVKAVAALQAAQPGAFELDVIVGVQIVEADDLVSAAQERVGREGANETRCARHEDFHDTPQAPSRRPAAAIRTVSHSQDQDNPWLSSASPVAERPKARKAPGDAHARGQAAGCLD
jgi:hypothetical protein